MVKTIVKLENLLIFVIALLVFWKLEGNWILYLVLFLTPDISILGYKANNKVGQFLYNLTHNYLLAGGIIGLGLFLHQTWIELFGVIVISHVGIDRFLGFGLKYREDFKQTHIQKL